MFFLAYYFFFFKYTYISFQIMKFSNFFYLLLNSTISMGRGLTTFLPHTRTLRQATVPELIFIVIRIYRPVLKQVVGGRQVRYPSVVQGLMMMMVMMEIGGRLMMVVTATAIVGGGHGPVVRTGRVQRRRVQVRVQHVGGRRRWRQWRRRGAKNGRRRRRRWHLDPSRVLDGGRGGRGGSGGGGDGCGRRQFPLGSARGQKVPQVRLVPAPGLRRLRLAGRTGGRGTGADDGGGRRVRPGQLFRVAKIAVRQTRVQVAHLEVHGSLAQQVAALFFPAIISRVP